MKHVLDQQSERLELTDFTKILMLLWQMTSADIINYIMLKHTSNAKVVF
jgi:hypothetical protein